MKNSKFLTIVSYVWLGLALFSFKDQAAFYGCLVMAGLCQVRSDIHETIEAKVVEKDTDNAVNN